MTYKELPLGRYMDIREIILDGSDWTSQQPRIMAVLNNMTEDEVLNLKLSKYQELTETLDFLKEPPKSNKCPKRVVINGKNYNVIRNAKDLTAGQFLDYQNYIGMKDYTMLPYILSVIIIPEGKEYGEYDMVEVIEDIREYLDSETAFGIFNFFYQAFLKYTRRMLRYSEALIKVMGKKEKNKERRKELEEIRSQMEALRVSLPSGGF